MKNANLPILLVVIAAVAIGAQFSRQSGEKPEWKLLRQDMIASLTSLWHQPGHQVELVPSGEGVDARVSVGMPRGLRLRQQRWNHPFLRLVASRHSGVQLKNLSVVEGGTDRLVPETAMAGLFADRVAPRVNFEDEEERLCQLTSRQLGAGLQRKLGTGLSLVLVDAQLARSQRENLVYGRRAASVAKPVSNRVIVTDICVVVDHEVSPGDWEKFRAENSLANYVNFRVVTLPKP